MRGRKAIPTSLKVLYGNPGHQKLNHNEPKPDMAEPEIPEWLATDADAKDKWDEVTHDLRHMGLLTRTDKDMITAYCVTYSQLKRAVLVMRKQGTTLKTARGDVARPEVAIARNSVNQLRQLASEFGLTPSSRARLTVGTSKDESDDLDDLLGVK